MKNLLGSIDIGGTKTMVGIIDTAGNVRAKRHFPTFTPDCYENFANCCTRFNECLAKLGVSFDNIEGIGINMPGMVDAEGILLQAPFAKWYNIDVKGYFAKAYNTDKIYANNDVNSCAIGEMAFGGAGDNFLWVTVSTGIGGAFVVDGKVIYGSNACAGELGHVKVEYEKPALCGCGQHGCVEAHGSGTAITRMFREKLQANHELSAIIEARGLPSDAKTCAILADQDNPEALDVYRMAGIYVGRALSYAANLVNPREVYIGGGVSDSLHLLLPSLLREFREKTVTQCADIEIRKTALTYDAALIGAAAQVMVNNREGKNIN